MKRLDFDVKKAIQLYRSGLTVDEVAGKLGISRSPLFRRFRQLGVEMRSRRKPVEIDDIRPLYESGLGLKAIGERFGVSEVVIAVRLAEAGVETRGPSEAMRVRWAQATMEQRGQMVAAAHKATRGRRRTEAELIQMARTRERTGNVRRSPAEAKLAALLSKKGVVCVPQQAIGRYNCDLGADPVAVEVFGGHWHFTGEHAARAPRRYRYFLDAGWHVIVVWLPQGRPPTARAADYIARFVKLARRQPSCVREYRMIRGTGELVTAGRADDEKIALVPPTTLGRDVATGRYKGVAR